MPLKTTDPDAEARRLARLHELLVLDSEPEPALDAIAKLASDTCGTPIALITLIDEHRQWFKANVGVPGLSETPRDVAFCSHTILQDALLEVPDATLDPRFSRFPSVAGPHAVRFYAGAPLILPGGERVGSLCVLDTRTRQLSASQAATLQALASVVCQTLTMRRDLLAKALSAKSAYEQILAETADEMADLYDNAPCGYHSLDATGRFVRMNNAALTWLGCARDDIVGVARMSDFLTPEGQELFRCNFPRLLRDGRLDDLEFDLVSRTGATRRVVANASTIKDANGNFVMTRTVMFDISELQRARNALRKLAAEQQAMEVARVKGVFLANMSHELRTPLNAVIGYAQLLQAGAISPDSPKFDKFLNQIGVSGRQLLKMIDAVLDFAKAEAGGLALKAEPVALKRLLQNTVDMFRDDARRQEIALAVEVDDGLVEVVADELRVSQLVAQFVSNAIKFSPKGGYVLVRAWPQRASDFRIEVEDTGIGIADADMPRLFSPFQQLSEGNTKAFAGAGLGLSLSKRIADAHGGTVGASSRLGVGSVFWVELPLNSAVEVAA